MLGNVIFTLFILGALAYVFLDSSNIKLTKKNVKKSKKTENKNDISKNTTPNKNTEEFLNFKKIISVNFGDKNIGIVKRLDDVYVGAIQINGTNVNLRANDEILLLEDSFQKILNGLDYPIQIFTQSKKIDIENYIRHYNERKKQLIKRYENEEKKLSFSKSISDIEKNKIISQLERLKNQITYAENLINFILNVCNDKQMIEKRYYIIIPYIRKNVTEDFEIESNQLENMAVNDIKNKAQSILASLSSADLTGHILSGAELAELLYISYNKSESESYKLSSALSSKFSHLVTTSIPVEIKTH